MSTSAPALQPWPAWKRAAGALRCFVSTGKLGITIYEARAIADALEGAHRLATEEDVARGVEAAWLAMWAPGKPPGAAPTEEENPLFWCQVRAAVIAAAVLRGNE